jgi:hypothetical protein
VASRFRRKCIGPGGGTDGFASGAGIPSEPRRFEVALDGASPCHLPPVPLAAKEAASIPERRPFERGECGFYLVFTVGIADVKVVERWSCSERVKTSISGPRLDQLNLFQPVAVPEVTQSL